MRKPFNKCLSERSCLEGRLGFVRWTHGLPQPLMYKKGFEQGAILTGKVLFLSNMVYETVIPSVKIFSLTHMHIGYVYIGVIDMFSFLEDYEAWVEYITS